MSVVRISSGKFDLANLLQVERSVVESERALRGALTKQPGLLHFFAAVDGVRGVVTNVSIWDTLEHAHQLDSLPEMLAQRPIVEAVGVTFQVITNHEVVWTITP